MTTAADIAPGQTVLCKGTPSLVWRTHRTPNGRVLLTFAAPNRDDALTINEVDATHPGQRHRGITWASVGGCEYGLSLEVYGEEMQFDFRRYEDGRESQRVVSNITPGAARLLRDRLDYFLSEVGR